MNQYAVERTYDYVLDIHEPNETWYSIHSYFSKVKECQGMNMKIYGE